MSNEIIERMEALPGLLHDGLAQAAGLVVFAQAGESGALACDFAAHLLEKATASVHDYSTLEAVRILEIAVHISEEFNKFSDSARIRAKLLLAHRLASAFSWCDPQIFRRKLWRAKFYADCLAEINRAGVVFEEVENVA